MKYPSKTKRSHLSRETLKLVSDAAYELSDKARHKLRAPVTKCEFAHAGTQWFGHKIHLWITISGKKIGLRIAEHRSRPKRKVLNDLMEENQPPTLLVYAGMRLWSVTRRLAECILIGLNRMRKGLIECVKEKVRDGEVEQCANGNFQGRFPSQLQLSVYQSALN